MTELFLQEFENNPVTFCFRANYWREQYQDVWKIIEKQRALVGKPNNQLINRLTSKMPEPKN